jgi:tetratricopeptide (TPR) repeat protein
LIVDFYIDEASQKAAQKKPVLKSIKPPADNELNVDLSKSTGQDRKPASDAIVVGSKGQEYGKMVSKKAVGAYTLFDGADPEFERFMIQPYEVQEDAVIQAQENEYLQFPLMKLPLSAWQKILTNPIQYEVSIGDDMENKQARLLLKLYQGNKDLVFAKTLEWFEQKYPQSKYHEMIKYMQADMKLKRWRDLKQLADFESAVQIQRELIEKYPESPATERTSLSIGFLLQERKDHLAALRAFQKHREFEFKKPTQSFSKDVAKLGQVISFNELRQYDKALELLSQVAETTKYKSLKQDAIFRRGDVYFSAAKFDDSVLAYQKALSAFPKAKLDFPNAYFNQAEAYFNQKKYYDALKAHVDFLKQFSVQDYTPYVLTRVGELLEILGAPEQKSRGAFMECLFRFGENSKAIVSKLRVLSYKMKSMRASEVAGGVDEIMKLALSSDLPGVLQFSTMMIADGFNERKEFEISIALLTKYYQENPTTVDQAKFRRRIVKNIADEIHENISSQKFLPALKTQQKYSQNWLKSSDRLDLKFDMGRAFEMAGLQKQSIQSYRDVLNQLYAIKNTPIEKEKKIKERLPSSELVNLRLAQVEASQNQHQKAWDHLKQIKNVDTLKPNEQVERMLLSVQLLKKKGDEKAAIRFLTDVLMDFKAEANLSSQLYWELANLEVKNGQPEEALASLQKIDLMMTDSGGVSEKIHGDSLKKSFEIQQLLKKDNLALQVGQRALDLYEAKQDLSQLRYQMGEIHFNQGAIQKATELWNTFQGKNATLWKKLSDEKLAGVAFDENYKKYMKRIPAMASPAQSQQSANDASSNSDGKKQE